MIGLRIKLTLDDKVLDEIELRHIGSKAEVRHIRDHGEEVSIPPSFPSADFFETYRNIVESYNSKIMSNEKITLSINSFEYRG
ncbi:MAG: hypothetical protein AABW51_05235 [Nanoarchaeota archaeon]